MEAAQPNPPDNARRGFFESLMDTRFDSLITPKLIRLLYVIGMVILTIAVIAVIIGGFVESAGTGVLALVLAPIVALIYLVVLRVYLELVIVAFKIREGVDTVAVNTRRPTA
jgi:hypothetical protein